MALEPGTRVGPYEVLAPLDAAPGSDQRYKATDSRANRLVTLKALPSGASEHPEGRQRLERDSRTISSLNHPNICALLEVVNQDPSTAFLVTEYADGETLAQRFARGRLDLAEALKIAIAMADSLDKAHRQGVVHGGLNPSTVLLAPTGPKLLDFGVARLTEPPTSSGQSVAPVSIATTRIGVATLSAPAPSAAPYLAPEQLAGNPADVRSDMFAFGTVLYEMITGRPAFQEKTFALLVAAIQSVDPDPVSKVQPMAPPALDHVVRRCLTKDPRQRLQTAWDLMTQLQWIAEGGSQIGVPVPIAASRQKQDLAVWGALAIVSMLAIGLVPSAWTRLRGAPPARPYARFLAAGIPSGAPPVSISPNGHWVVTSPGSPNTGVLALPLNAVATQILVKDNIITQPFWSPDSKSIGFFEDGKLKKAEVAGGPSQTVCDVMNPIGGGTWNADGVMLFSAAGLIYRVSAAGGQPTAITALDKSKGETDHLGPNFLPDGRHYLFLAAGTESAIYLGTLDAQERTRLFTSDSKAVFAAAPIAAASMGFVLFNRGTTVFAQPFDAKKLAFTGEPIRVADGVPTVQGGPNVNPNSTRSGSFAVSQTGVLVFRNDATAAQNQGGSAPEERSIFWFDRGGVRSGSLGPAGAYVGVDLSPDGKRVALHRHEGSGGDSWVFDFAENRMQRLTFDATQDNQSPIWSPDGTRIAFASRRSNKWGLYVKRADGTGTDELITESEAVKNPMSWSPDGKLLVYTQAGQARDIWAVPVADDKKPFPIVQTPADEAFAQVSPDGKWLAYMSNETARQEIYVKPFPDGPGKWQVSTDGGNWPRWSHDSKDLYFILAPNVMASEMRVTGSSIQAGAPRILFGIDNPTANHNNPSYHRYAVSADGKNFLTTQSGAGGGVAGGGVADQIAAIADRGGTAPASISGVSVVLDWPRLLTKK
jgi:Tol biopolymer transport system component